MGCLSNHPHMPTIIEWIHGDAPCQSAILHRVCHSSARLL